MKLLMRGWCCYKQTHTHPHHVRHVSVLVVGRLPEQLIPATTRSLPVPEELVRSVPLDDAWGGLAVLMAEMCRPEVIALVLEGSGVEVKPALCFVGLFFVVVCFVLF